MVRCKNKGFTVIETFIFLTISGVIFIAVALLIAGQLNRYQSRDAVIQAESTVRGVLNDVSNGYYPQIGRAFTCHSGTPKPTYTSIVAQDDKRGTNVGNGTSDFGCLIAGKSITFRNNDMLIQTMVANGNIDEVPAYNQLTTINELDETKIYKWQMSHDPANNVTYYILNTNYKPSESSGQFISGSQAVQIYYSNSMQPVLSTNNNNKICFENGGRKSSISFDENALSVYSYYEDKGCL
jgi:hypothetical protein